MEENVEQLKGKIEGLRNDINYYRKGLPSGNSEFAEKLAEIEDKLWIIMDSSKPKCVLCESEEYVNDYIINNGYLKMCHECKEKIILNVWVK